MVRRGANLEKFGYQGELLQSNRRAFSYGERRKEKKDEDNYLHQISVSREEERRRPKTKTQTRIQTKTKTKATRSATMYLVIHDCVFTRNAVTVLYHLLIYLSLVLRASCFSLFACQQVSKQFPIHLDIEARVFLGDEPRTATKLL